jgi:N-acylneuraminate cytidylyltransferase
MNDQQRLSMIWPENINARSQDLPVAFHDAGQFYFFNVPRFLSTRNMMIGDIGGIELDEMHVQDIDTEADWRVAELKYKLITEPI